MSTPVLRSPLLDSCWRPIGRGIHLLPWRHEAGALRDLVRSLSEELFLIHIHRSLYIAGSPAAPASVTLSAVAHRTAASCVRDFLLHLRFPLREIVAVWAEFFQQETWFSFRNQSYSSKEQTMLKAIAMLLLDAYLWHLIRDKLLFIGAEYLEHAALTPPAGQKDSNIYSAVVAALLNHPYHVPPALLHFQTQSRRRSPQAQSPFADAALLRRHLNSLVCATGECFHWILLLMSVSSVIPPVQLHWPVSAISTASPSLWSVGQNTSVCSPASAVCALLRTIARIPAKSAYDFLLSMALHMPLTQKDLCFLSSGLPEREFELSLLCPNSYHARLTVIRNLKALLLFIPKPHASLGKAVNNFVTLSQAQPGFLLKAWMRVHPDMLRRHATTRSLAGKVWERFGSPRTPVLVPSPVSPPEETYTIKLDSTPSCAIAPAPPKAAVAVETPPLKIKSGDAALQVDSVGATVTLEGYRDDDRDISLPVMFEYQSNVLLDARAASILYIVACTTSARPSVHLAGILSSRFHRDGVSGYCFDFERGLVFAVLQPQLLRDNRGLSAPLACPRARRFPVVPGAAGAFYLSMSPYEISWGAQKSVKAKLEVSALPPDSWIDCHYFVILGLDTYKQVHIATRAEDTFDPMRPCLRLHQCVVPSGRALPRHLHSPFYNRDNLGRESLAALLRPGVLDLSPPRRTTGYDVRWPRDGDAVSDAPRARDAVTDSRRDAVSDAPARGAASPAWRKRGRPTRRNASDRRSGLSQQPRLETKAWKRDRDGVKRDTATETETQRKELEADRRKLRNLLEEDLDPEMTGGRHFKKCTLCTLENIDVMRIPLKLPEVQTRQQEQEARRPEDFHMWSAAGSRSLRLWETVPLRMDFGAPGRLNRFRYSAVSERR